MTLLPTCTQSIRFRAFVLCLFAVAVCLTYGILRNSFSGWWRQNGGGVPYVLFFITLAFTIFPTRRSILPICLGTTLITSALELLQLWKPEWLVEIRRTTAGAALLGSDFSWMDIPPYFIGGLLGWLLLTALESSRQT